MTKENLIKGSIIIMILTILSKFFGFFREMLIASTFGASYATDIYTFAMGLVSMFFASIGSGLGTTFIPMLSEHIEKGNYSSRNRFVNNIVNIITLLVFILVIFGIIFAKYIVYIFAPGYRANVTVFNDTVNITCILFFCMFFIGLQNILTGVLQTHNIFGVPASISIFSNLIFILYLIFFAQKYGIYGFAFVTVIAYFVQFIIHIPTYKKLGYKYNFIVDFHDESLKRMLILMVPVIIGTSIGQVNFLIDRFFATTVGEGSIAVLNFANKLNLFVYSIFAVAISTVIYPSLSAFTAQDDEKGYKNALIKAINSILLIMIPATVGMVILKDPIITIVFKRGAFDEKAASLTALALLFYSPAMLVYGIRDVLNKGFYSIKNTLTPMINSIIGIVLNIILNTFLVKYMEVGGLALATSISAIITTLLLIYSLNKKLKYLGIKEMLISFGKMVLASSIMGVLIFIINNIILKHFGNGFKGSLISVGVSFIIGVVVYFGSIYLLKLNEFLYILRYIKSKAINKAYKILRIIG